MSNLGGGNASGLNANLGNPQQTFAALNQVMASLVSVVGKLGDLGAKGLKLLALAPPAQTQRQQLGGGTPSGVSGESPTAPDGTKKTGGSLIGTAAKQLSGAAGVLLAAAKFLTAEPKVQSNMSALNEMATPSILDMVRAQVANFYSDPLKNLMDVNLKTVQLPGDLLQLATDRESPNKGHYFGDAPFQQRMDDGGVPDEGSWPDAPTAVDKGVKADHP